MMFAYRFLLTLVAPLIAIRFAWALLRGRESLRDLRERLALIEAPSLARGPRIWVHAASLGELAAARPLVEKGLAQVADLQIVLSCNSLTGRRAALEWGLARVIVTLAPLDFRWVLRRFLGLWQPEALIVVETEIWPNRFAFCADRNIPVVLASARLSQGSARFWGRFGASLRRKVFGQIAYAAPQDAASAARLAALGVQGDALGPELLLKSGSTLANGAQDSLRDLAAHFPRARTVLAASTHEGEDAIVLRAFLAARQSMPDLRLIIAPRHPARAAAIAQQVRDAGLGVAVRSRGDSPAADVYLADTLGEMGLWFALAPVTFMGGSLVAKGGHTPFEPAQFDTVVLHGPHIENNATAYGAMAAAGGALPISGADDLAHMIRSLLRDPDRMARIARAGRDALQPLRRADDGIARLWARIGHLLGDARFGK